MIDYIVLFGLAILLILFCIFCHKKSVIFVCGILWFIVAIVRKFVWIYSLNFLTNTSADIESSQLEAHMIFTSYIMNELMYLRLGLLIVIVGAFLINAYNKKLLETQK